MITYNESKRGESFDWNEAIEAGLNDEIEARQGYHHFLIEMASGWVTCACGNQCASIPRSIRGVPLDFKLLELGASFYHEIVEAEWEAAKACLAEIEKRSAELVAEQKGGSK